VSPPHVARIASVTGIQPPDHDLSLTETSHRLFTLSPSLKEDNVPLQPRPSVSYPSRGVKCPRTTRPERVLDAPRMVGEDEWGACGNVMSWFSETGLFVGLGKQVFSLNTKTSVVSSFGTTNSEIMSLEITMSGKMMLLRLQNGEVHYADASPNIVALMTPSQPKDRARACCHRERKFAIGDYSGHLTLLDIRSPRDIQKFEGHASDIYGLGWSDDGNHIASSAADKKLKVWDLRMMSGSKPLLIKRGFASPVKVSDSNGGVAPMN
jgi:WD40 repeat protein